MEGCCVYNQLSPGGSGPALWLLLTFVAPGVERNVPSSLSGSLLSRRWPGGDLEGTVLGLPPLSPGGQRINSPRRLLVHLLDVCAMLLAFLNLTLQVPPPVIPQGGVWGDVSQAARPLQKALPWWPRSAFRSLQGAPQGDTIRLLALSPCPLPRADTCRVVMTRSPGLMARIPRKQHLPPLPTVSLHCIIPSSVRVLPDPGVTQRGLLQILPAPSSQRSLPMAAPGLPLPPKCTPSLPPVRPASL